LPTLPWCETGLLGNRPKAEGKGKGGDSEKGGAGEKAVVPLAGDILQRALP